MTLTESTAETIAYHAGHESITERDMHKATEMVRRWNENRVAAGLMPLDENKQGAIVGAVVVESEDE
jgi:hypothetical protein